MIFSERRSRGLSWLQVVAICLLVAVVTMVVTGFVVTQWFEDQKAAAGAYPKLDEIRSLVDTYYVGEYNDDELMDMLASGFAYGINDQWAYYTPKDEMDLLEQGFTGVYGGIGVTVNPDITEGFMSVLEVYPNSPAERAGILPLDKIIAVDGRFVAELGREGTVAAVRGEEGTTVQLTVYRGENELVFDVDREIITRLTVYSEVFNGNIGYLRVSEFAMSTAAEFAEKLSALEQLDVSGLVVDMRNNPGGQLDTLIAMLDRLMPEGVAFIQRDKFGQEDRRYVDDIYWDIPITVLVNQYSYSAAEYFAAVLQESGIAKVVGASTTGKGEAQSTFKLSDGSAVTFSVLRYYTPQGVSIAQQGGIVPDVVIPMDDEFTAQIGRLTPEEDVQLAEALALLQ